MTKLDAHYANPKLAEVYDAGSGWGKDRYFYLSLAGDTPIRILDLGCGTGLICDAYAAKGHIVTGADPAESMLNVARRKPNGHKIEWVQSEAQAFASKNLYDLVIMTGHAFQVLLEESDVKATFRMVRDHLAPGGRFVFESRNPDIEWESRWNETEILRLPSADITYERKVHRREGNRIHFETIYHFDDETLVSQSELRFWTAAEIKALLEQSGLRVSEFLGDWDGSPFIPSSDEIIFIAQARG